MINRIVSLRNVMAEPFYDVAFEWEEVLAEYFHVELFNLSKVRMFVQKIYCKLYKQWELCQDLRKPINLYFVMFPHHLRYYQRMNGIPVFVDVWSDKEIDFIIEKTRNIKMYYVTSRDVFQRIREKDSLNPVKYMPLSVSDKYYSEQFEKYQKKDIDVIQLGRNNRILHEYMLKYAKEHEDIDYVYAADTEHNKTLEYTSTKRGFVGVLKDRDAFMNMLANSKVSLISTPGMDNSRKNSNGINFPTPRFYESAILGCGLLGRYVKNKEMADIGVESICPNIESYEDFEKELEVALSKNRLDLFKQSKEFIKKNLTSCRAAQIERDLAEFI